MGAVVSTESIGEISTTNEPLKLLTGQQQINCNDPRWNKLFSFNFNLDQRNRKLQSYFMEQMNPLLEQLMHNTRETGNFATLVRTFIRRCSELEASAKCENKIFIWQTANALLIIRIISTFIAQRLSPMEFAKIFGNYGRITKQNNELNNSIPNSLAQQFAEVENLAEFDNEIDHSDGNSNKFESIAEQLLANLLDILTNIPINNNTIQLHAETIRVILALLSTQIYEENVNERSEFLRLLMHKFNSRSNDIVRVLLENFLQHQNELLDAKSNGGSNQKRAESSLVLSLWSTLQRTLTFGGSFDENEYDFFPQQTLASLSLELLLTLVYYPFDNQQNPFKQMLSIFQNAQEVSSLANLEASFKLDFTKLYNRLCQTVYKEREPLLLLYLLIHNNIGFRNFVLSRINLEQLVVPVTQVLYDGICSTTGSSPPSPSKQHNSSISDRRQSVSSNPYSSSTIHTHQIYLSLIILLMLSEDDFFKKIIHEMTLKNVDWYQPERAPLSEITLGGLIILVFSKTIQINTLRIRDRYFHVNSLATLANLSSCFKQLSPFVCQKLIGLLETMSKRHSKLIRVLRENAEKTIPEKPLENAEEDLDELKELNDDLHRDITALEEGIRTVLEIINASLCHNLRNNPDLIYTVLYKRELFEHYHQHPMFQDLVWNIYAVINHFTSRVEALIKANNGNNSPTPSGQIGALSSNASVAEILEAIKKTAIEWPTDRLKKFPDLRFKYIEDDNTVDFFIPYIWRLIHEGAGIIFDPTAIQLFKVIDTK